MGRKKGGKNAPGHHAGGARKGAGRPRKDSHKTHGRERSETYDSALHPESEESDTEQSPSHKMISVADIHPAFIPFLTMPHHIPLQISVSHVGHAPIPPQVSSGLEQPSPNTTAVAASSPAISQDQLVHSTPAHNLHKSPTNVQHIAQTGQGQLYRQASASPLMSRSALENRPERHGATLAPIPTTTQPQNTRSYLHSPVRSTPALTPNHHSEDLPDITDMHDSPFTHTHALSVEAQQHYPSPVTPRVSAPPITSPAHAQNSLPTPPLPNDNYQPRSTVRSNHQVNAGPQTSHAGGVFYVPNRAPQSLLSTNPFPQHNGTISQSQSPRHSQPSQASHTIHTPNVNSHALSHVQEGEVHPVTSSRLSQSQATESSALSSRVVSSADTHTTVSQRPQGLRTHPPSTPVSIQTSQRPALQPTVNPSASQYRPLSGSHQRTQWWSSTPSGGPQASSPTHTSTNPTQITSVRSQQASVSVQPYHSGSGPPSALHAPSNWLSHRQVPFSSNSSSSSSGPTSIGHIPHPQYQPSQSSPSNQVHSSDQPTHSHSPAPVQHNLHSNTHHHGPPDSVRPSSFPQSQPVSQLSSEHRHPPTEYRHNSVMQTSHHHHQSPQQQSLPQLGHQSPSYQPSHPLQSPYQPSPTLHPAPLLITQNQSSRPLISDQNRGFRGLPPVQTQTQRRDKIDLPKSATSLQRPHPTSPLKNTSQSTVTRNVQPATLAAPDVINRPRAATSPEELESDDMLLDETGESSRDGRQRRRCAVCVQSRHPERAYDCPGRGDRTRCISLDADGRLAAPRPYGLEPSDSLRGTAVTYPTGSRDVTKDNNGKVLNTRASPIPSRGSTVPPFRLHGVQLGEPSNSQKKYSDGGMESRVVILASGQTNKRKRRCAICVKLGKDGLGCPGRGNRNLCRSLPQRSLAGEKRHMDVRV